MGIGFLLSQPFAQHALLAAGLVAVSGGLISPFVVTRGMAFAVHGTAELAFTGAAAGLLVAGNPVLGALAGSLVVAALIATLGARQRERDSAIGAILAFGMGIGILLLSFYQGFATAATNILFGNIFGVSGSQLLVLLTIGLIVVVVMGIWYRPLLFASIDPETAEARGGPVRPLRRVVLACLCPAWVADGGCRVRSAVRHVKASVFTPSLSFAISLPARLTGPTLRARRHYHHEGHELHHAAQGTHPQSVPAVHDTPASTASPAERASPQGPPARHTRPRTPPDQ